jgi:hypothetical protein
LRFGRKREETISGRGGQERVQSGACGAGEAQQHRLAPRGAQRPVLRLAQDLAGNLAGKSL